MAYYNKVGDYTPGTRARGLEVETEFDTIEDGFDKVELVVDENGALGKDLTGGAAYQLTGMVDGVNPQDYATMANVAAEVAGGGSPGDIPITSLGVGTANADEFIVINSGGTSPEGQSGSTVAPLIPITSLGVGTATARQNIQINGAGTAVIGRDQELGNFLINGDMRVSQQGTSYTSATNPANSDDTYLLDGWYLLSDGNDIYDVTQHTTAADLPDGAYAALRLDVETISKKGGVIQILESREVARIFEAGNGTCSLSFKAKRTGSSMELKASVLAWDSTADAVTSDVVSAWNADGTTPTFVANWISENTPANLGLSTSYQTFRIEDVSLDTASTTNLAIFIWVDTTTSNLGELVYITDVQLERGNQATEYERSSISLELLRSKRFLHQITSTGILEAVSHGHVDNSGAATRAPIRFPIEMRAEPTVSVSALSHFRSLAGGSRTPTSVNVEVGGTSVIGLSVGHAVDTAGHGALFYMNNASGWIRFSSTL